MLLGTSWKLGELDGNTLGTKEKTKPCPFPPPQKKKIGLLKSECELSHWSHETFISKIVCHHFLAWANGKGTNCETW
jgi:hypothetical protein